MFNTDETVTRLSIHRKLIWLFVLTTAGILAFLIFFYFQFYDGLQLAKKDQTKNLTEAGMGIVRHYHQLVLTGQMTSDDAKKSATNALASATYGDNGYYWLFDGAGKLLMQPYEPAKVGLNLKNETDANGKYFFRDFISTAKSGGGWVSYYWPKPHAKGQYPKLSYVGYFKPWDWVLGTGVYVDDLKGNTFWVVFDASWIMFGVFIFFIVFIVYIANSYVSQIEGIAIRDPLTNLYTMRFLKEITPSLLSKQQREKDIHLAAIFIDIDHFKNVNDSYGHDCGDIVLAQLARLMMSMTRPNDFCIRFGGEEFIFIGFFDNSESAVNAADRIRIEASKVNFNCKGNDFNVTLSAGIALYSNKFASFDDMLKHADEKMYHSKNNGRNRVSI